MASPDPIAAERAHYLALLGWTADDPAVTLSQLRAMTGGGVDARSAAEAKITEQKMVAGSAFVRSVNGTIPDVNGNVTVAGGGGSSDWNALINKPATFPPDAHSHPISGVTSLQAALDAKSPTGHTHSIANTTGLQGTLDNKSPVGHGHVISDVTSLQSTLDGKAATAHSHAISDTTGLQAALDSKAATSHQHSIDDLLTTGVKDGTKFLRDDGTWAAPPSGGGGSADTGTVLFMSAGTVTRANIQQALNTYDTVYLPSGSFNMDSTSITVPQSKTLRGSGRAWEDGVTIGPAKGTVLVWPTSASPGEGVVKLADDATLSNLNLISAGGFSSGGSAHGVEPIGSNGYTVEAVRCAYFGGWGFFIDSKDSGAGNTSTRRVNFGRFDSCSAYRNGSNNVTFGAGAALPSATSGGGWWINGSDSNQGRYINCDSTANKGAQVALGNTSKNVLDFHINSAGIGTLGVWHFGMSNTWERCYMEASGSPVGGDYFVIGNGATGQGSINLTFYGMPKGPYYVDASNNLVAVPVSYLESNSIFVRGGVMGSWNLYNNKGRQGLDGATNQTYWTFDVGIPDGDAQLRLRGNSANGGAGTTVFDVNKAVTRLAYGVPTVDKTYTTATRPSGMPAGTCIFDTTLGKPVWYNGSAWKDATGATV